MSIRYWLDSFEYWLSDKNPRLWAASLVGLFWAAFGVALTLGALILLDK